MGEAQKLPVIFIGAVFQLVHHGGGHRWRLTRRDLVEAALYAGRTANEASSRAS